MKEIENKNGIVFCLFYNKQEKVYQVVSVNSHGTILVVGGFEFTEMIEASKYYNDFLIERGIKC